MQRCNDEIRFPCYNADKANTKINITNEKF